MSHNETDHILLVLILQHHFWIISKKVLVFQLVRHNSEITPSNFLNEHWLQFEANQLLAHTNQQNYNNSKINVSATKNATVLALSQYLLTGYSKGNEKVDKKPTSCNIRFYFFTVAEKYENATGL